MPITLPEDHGTVFDEGQLIAYLKAQGRRYIVQGQQHVAFVARAHKESESRLLAENSDRYKRGYCTSNQ